MSEKVASEAAPTVPAGERAWAVPRWVKELFVVGAVAALIAVAVSQALTVKSDKLERAKLALDAQDARGVALPLSLPRRGGGSYSLAESRGKLTVVNFWATWCPPCREEMPSLSRLAAQMDPSTFQLVAVSVDKTWDEVEQFFDKRPVPYTVALDAGGKVSLSYGTSKFPETYVIDGQGNLKLKFIGPRDWGDQRVVALLEQLGAKRRAGATPTPRG